MYKKNNPAELIDFDVATKIHIPNAIPYTFFPSHTSAHAHPGPPRLRNNARLLSNLSLRNALLTCNNRSDNALASR